MKNSVSLLSQLRGRHNQGLFAIVGFLCGLLLFPLVTQIEGVNDFLGNLVPEAVGIIFTVAIIDRLNIWREEQQLKKRLVEQLGSRVNAVAVAAAEGLWANGWWSDDTLEEAHLERADLRGVDFGKANLTGVRFHHPRYGAARFDETTIMPDESKWSPETDLAVFTDPENSQYWRGHGLRGKSLVGKNLENANLKCADLRDCDLRKANLRGADLRGAQMQGSNVWQADLTNARFDETTYLPDGTLWAEGADPSAKPLS